jgi:hypothetical protein
MGRLFVALAYSVRAHAERAAGHGQHVVGHGMLIVSCGPHVG